ncbi:MAG TPA: efflux RND transporter permease subunit [Burkholderiaceae bacterium]|nr:efflux RND transporter permease subunit [Burkholderiaceae bacterium]
MWIVRLALRRPYSFAVMALLMLVLGGASIVVMRKDIFPTIGIPVISVIWSYTGMPPQEMADRIVTIDERAMTTTVNDIEHMESSSYAGTSVIRVFLQPGTQPDSAIAQITALSQTILRPLPTGIFPPNIVQYDASSVPVLQLGLSSDGLSQQELFDYGQNFIRTQLATVEGASVPLPYGGQSPSIMVDLDPEAMYGKHVSATDVANALSAQNLIVPAGTAKIGRREYVVQMNSSPPTVEGLDRLPLKSADGAIVHISDVAQVRQGHTVQTNIVRQDGRHAALLTVLRHGQASTLDIVDGVKKQLAQTLKSLPSTLRVRQLFDQSVFVKAAMDGVVREAAIAAALTALMIVLFLGSWRSTLIVCMSIPLSILTSLVVLALLGQTINVMTLGGLALAVGILVDDATVEIENIHRNIALKKPLTRAILDGASQIAVPALVSTLSICVVFVPVLLLTGAAQYLFTPLAGAVVFAMLASYLLSRTLVPAMAHALLGKEMTGKDESGAHGTSFLRRIHEGFDRRFERGRERYRDMLGWALAHRGLTFAMFGGFCLVSFLLVLGIGRDFFPYVDSGQMRLHVRTPAGTRIEETEVMFGRVEDEIRRVIPPAELQTLLDNIGLPPYGLNLAYGDTATIGANDGDILVSLRPGHRPTQELQRTLRRALQRAFPEETFFFQAANITNQILDFGRQSPIDVQVLGRDREHNLGIARALVDKIRRIPGAVDAHLGQMVDAPTVALDVDREKALQAGLTQRDVANSTLISLASSGQVAPTQWLDPQNGVSYNVAVQTPPYRIDSFEALRRTPLTGSTAGANTQLLGNLATFRRTTSSELVSHYDVQPVFDVYADTDERDLGGVASDIHHLVDEAKKDAPQGTRIEVRGLVQTMEESFSRLEIGVGFAVLFVYLLIVVNFQSWRDPLVILSTVPGTFAGILWMLYLTGTTFNVPSLMGSIMAVGVATSNSILLVVFANDERRDGKNAIDAALSAGYTRARPVVMTALAMIIGMLPMALALGEGGEQNAPLGRAVIGGLLVATLSTLFIVPLVYAASSKEPPPDRDKQIEDEYHEGEDDKDKDKDKGKDNGKSGNRRGRPGDAPAQDGRPPREPGQPSPAPT